MDVCIFDEDKECPLNRIPDKPGWCQACAILELSTVQKKSNQIQNILMLTDLRETFLQTLPFQRPELEDTLKNRLIKATEKLKENNPEPSEEKKWRY